VYRIDGAVIEIPKCDDNGMKYNILKHFFLLSYMYFLSYYEYDNNCLINLFLAEAYMHNDGSSIQNALYSHPATLPCSNKFAGRVS